MGGFGLSGKTRFGDSGSEIFAIESGDKTDADAFRTDGLTLILIAARAESFSIHGFRSAFTQEDGQDDGDIAKNDHWRNRSEGDRAARQIQQVKHDEEQEHKTRGGHRAGCK